MTSGLRERKKLATRQRLHHAALQLVAQHGLEQVSVNDIAERADVSARTFFNYFETKEAAVIGLDPGNSSSLAAAYRLRPSDESPVQALRAALDEQAQEMAQDSEVWPLRLQVIDSHPVLAGHLTTEFGKCERLLADAIAERIGADVNNDVYPTLLAAVQAAVMRASLRRWHSSGFIASLPDLVSESWVVVLAGLPAPEPHS